MTAGPAAQPKKKAWRPGNRNRKPTAWQLSLSFASMGAENLRRFHANRARYAKCGAKAKSTGEPCKQLALANGRCRYHGGATPSGADWSKRQLRAKPKSKSTAHAWRQTEAKLKRIAAIDEDRVRRLRAMSDEEFRTYLRRMGRRLKNLHLAPIFAAALRSELKRRAVTIPSKLVETSAPEAPVSAELREIERRIDELRAALAGSAGDQPSVFD